MIGPPVRMSETPGAVRSPAPLLGEHTEQILRIGSESASDEMSRLKERG